MVAGGRRGQLGAEVVAARGRLARPQPRGPEPLRSLQRRARRAHGGAHPADRHRQVAQRARRRLLEPRPPGQGRRAAERRRLALAAHGRRDGSDGRADHLLRRPQGGHAGLAGAHRRHAARLALRRLPAGLRAAHVLRPCDRGAGQSPALRSAAHRRDGDRRSGVRPAGDGGPAAGLRRIDQRPAQQPRSPAGDREPAHPRCLRRAKPGPHRQDRRVGHELPRQGRPRGRHGDAALLPEARHALGRHRQRHPDRLSRRLSLRLPDRGRDLHPGRAGRAALPAALQRQRRRPQRAHPAHHGARPLR